LIIKAFLFVVNKSASMPRTLPDPAPCFKAGMQEKSAFVGIQLFLEVIRPQRLAHHVLLTEPLPQIDSLATRRAKRAKRLLEERIFFSTRGTGNDSRF